MRTSACTQTQPTPTYHLFFYTYHLFFIMKYDYIYFIYSFGITSPTFHPPLARPIPALYPAAPPPLAGWPLPARWVTRGCVYWGVTARV